MKSTPMFIAALLLTVAGVCNANPPKSEAKTISHRAFSDGDYQSSVKNWDDQKKPVFCASISNQKQWDAAFGATAVMGKKIPFSPEKAVFDKEQLVFISRVVPGSETGNPPASLKLESISMAGTSVEFRYRHDPAKEGKSTFTMKRCLGAFIPKGDYKKAIFIENGKTIATLDLAAGEFASPKPAHD